MINLTEKERLLLEDEKSHEELCIEKYTKYSNEASCPQLKQIFTDNGNQERQHLNTLNQMLSGEIPDMIKQQQQQQMNTQAQQNNNQMQSAPSNQNYNQNDAKLCTDLLMTEKYVSSTYNTSIFEFTNKDFRQALNHIQKEEQEHGEKIFNYMQSNGMYNAK